MGVGWDGGVVGARVHNTLGKADTQQQMQIGPQIACQLSYIKRASRSLPRQVFPGAKKRSKTQGFWQNLGTCLSNEREARLM